MKFLSFLRTTSLWILLLPVAFTFTGAASNQAVLIANHDTFPVNVNRVKLDKYLEDEDGNVQPAVVLADGTVMLDATHCVMSSKTHLNFLADEFDLRSIYSVGDFLIMVGEWLQGFAFFVYVFAVTQKLRKVQS
jgi:hypothetical protein